MNGNKYQTAMTEVRSVLDEWLTEDQMPSWPEGYDWNGRLTREIVERLISKGVIQSTDPADLAAETVVTVRRGALPPGRTVIGGDLVPEHPPTPGSVQRSEDDG